MVMVCLLVIALMVASTVPVGAKKPPKDPPPDEGSDPTGTIFYTHGDANGDLNIYSMNPDGSSKTKEVLWVDGMDAMSLEKHKDGHYWFIGFIPTTGSHPDGVSKTKLVAIRDDNDKTVTLLEDPTMSYDEWNGPPCWLSDDEHLSWAALKWTEDGEIVDVGIYKAEISFGTSDDDPELSPTPTLVWSTGTFHHGQGWWYTPEVNVPRWSPDGLKFVMHSIENGCTLVDFSTGEGVDTILGGLGAAFWSPDGTKLAYAYTGKLHVMNIDGTDDTVLITYRTNKKVSRDMRNVRWSPDGEYLMYNVLTFKLTTWEASSEIYVIGADGSGNTCLTQDITYGACRWWR